MIVSWIAVFVGALSAPPPGLVSVLGVVLLEAFLWTGLFITAHDAMHGLVVPGNRRLNHWIGTTALWVHSGLRFSRMLPAHLEHHRAPGQHDDPDYHEGRGGALGWALCFMWKYASFSQIAWMALVFNVLHHVVGVSQSTLVVFWIAPMLLSTAQLFFVGTYLPHRLHGPGRDDVHRARSLELPTLLSFLACYHFGYHYEHHASPSTPWWRLPSRRRQLLAERYSAASRL
ncbi:MAG: beta-carotene ketolase (CrtW type) [Bradymonadia bacterium]